MSSEWLTALRKLSTDWHKPHIEDAPYLVVVFEQSYGLSEDGEKVKHYYVRESVGIAVGFLLAAFHASGLATLTHTPSPMGFLGEILDRPPNERAFVLIPVGYPVEQCVAPDLERKPVETTLVRHNSSAGAGCPSDHVSTGARAVPARAQFRANGSSRVRHVADLARPCSPPTRELHNRLHTHRTMGQEQVVLNGNSP